jgi:hypothetical protein
MSTETKKTAYQIRYNTNAKNASELWRILFDQQEILVSSITIFAPATTTRDFVNEINDFKYHITAFGNMELKWIDQENNLREAIINKRPID